MGIFASLQRETEDRLQIFRYDFFGIMSFHLFAPQLKAFTHTDTGLQKGWYFFINKSVFLKICREHHVPSALLVFFFFIIWAMSISASPAASDPEKSIITSRTLPDLPETKS